MRWAIAAIFLVLTTAAPAQSPLFDPVSGYRITQYRGVVDRALEGVARIDVTQVAALRLSAVLIDVTPAEGGVRGEDGRWRLALPHETIPGAHWFPEAGRGVQPPGIGAWFDRGVRRLTRDNRKTPIVVFCLANCWMSWNAALRLHRAGYTRISWFGEGSDGWKENGRLLIAAMPEKP